MTRPRPRLLLHDGAEPIIKRWVATDVTTNSKVQQELKEFFLQHGVKQVAMSDGNMGCPHEEGLDFPHNEDYPFWPFWKGKQGSGVRNCKLYQGRLFAQRPGSTLVNSDWSARPDIRKSPG